MGVGSTERMLPEQVRLGTHPFTIHCEKSPVNEISDAETTRPDNLRSHLPARSFWPSSSRVSVVPWRLPVQVSLALAPVVERYSLPPDAEPLWIVSSVRKVIAGLYGQVVAAEQVPSSCHLPS